MNDEWEQEWINKKWTKIKKKAAGHRCNGYAQKDHVNNRTDNNIVLYKVIEQKILYS